MVSATVRSRLALITFILTITICGRSMSVREAVGAWQFNEGSGNVAYNASSAGRPAYISSGMRWHKAGTTWTVSADGPGNGYVTVPALNLSDSSAVTVTLWVNRVYSGTGGGVLFEDSEDYRQTDTGFALLVDDDSCQGMQAVLKGNEGTTANCYAQPSSGAWHQIAVAYDKSQTGGNGISLYIDGVLQAPTWNLASSTNTNKFGNNKIYLLSHAGKSQFTSGTISDLRIYDSALSSEQVQQTYNETLLQSPASISYVQGNYADPLSSQLTVTVPFTTAQTAGDLNTVIIGWKDSQARISQVTDSKGNVYNRAVGPTVIAGVASQAIYYAKNIASAGPGANTVRVTFSTAANKPDVRIAEYRGADTSNPLDVVAAASGLGQLSSSGYARTTSANDLILGADLVQSVTQGPGSGFTKRLMSSPQGNILEDRSVSAVGSYAATAPLLPTARWIMQMVAFRSQVTGGNFTISASPASLTIPQGGHGASTITTAISNGFNSSIALSASGVPSGTTVSFNPATIPAPGSGNSTMTITVGSTTPTGNYSIVVTGNGGGVQQSVTVTLTVTGSTGFTVSASPSSLSVMQGMRGTSTITTVVSGGFNNSISLSASGMPSGTTVTFNPATIPAPGSGSSTMTVTVGSTTHMGTYPITVTASGGGTYRTVVVNLTVTAQIALTWNASPGSAGYNIYRATVHGGPYTKVNTSLDPNTSYNDQAVQDGRTYYYVTTAVDGQGRESGYSNEASAYLP